MFVDDDADFLEAVQLMLLDKGFEVITAADGVDAVREYKEGRPDIVFLDIKMPGIDGYEVFFRIARYDPDARVVFTSSYAIDGERYRRAVSLSLRGMLRKPIEFGDLRKMIQKHSK